MNISYIMNVVFMALSIMVAIIIRHLPLGDTINHINWVLILLLYWLLSSKIMMGPILAMILGLAVDILTGRLIGMQALLFSSIAFFSISILKQYKKPGMHVIAMLSVSFIIAYELIFRVILYSFYGVHAMKLNFFITIMTNLIAAALVWIVMDYFSRFKIFSWGFNE